MRRDALPVYRMLRGAASIFVLLSLLLGSRALAAPAAHAQSVRVLLVSDIHFEPFWDPDKAGKLAAAPVDDWAAIFSSPDSPDRQQRFTALQQQCHVRGEDTSYTLLRSSLAAMRSHAARPIFIAISGDLVAHNFTCKFGAAFPDASAAAYREFVEKTIQFVLLELRSTFPRTPVFPALGNNDTACGDYAIDAGSPFLRALAPSMTADVHGPLRKAALNSFAAQGDYSAALPAPFSKKRLLVLDNLFESANYHTCAGKPNLQIGREQVAWLQGQLEAARRKHESVWVVGHIPPGIDPYSTARKVHNLCSGQSPVEFLSSNALGDTLADFSDVVKLAVFAHTHMDELRLLRSAPAGSGAPALAVKLVPSISPVDGNHPSFVVAQVVPASAALKDYQVIAASNNTGIGTHWAVEYDFGQEYNEAWFTAASVANLIEGFSTDRSASTRASQSYINNYFVGAHIPELKLFWPQYVCALTDTGAAVYRSCVCMAGK